jgi:carbamoyl-phosphate synthase small subunit
MPALSPDRIGTEGSVPALLVLEDGTWFPGFSLGAQGTAFGEVVFTTSMTGYQEMLTDPSFAGQIVVPTYPLIGNYGINGSDSESKAIQVSGFVVREACDIPSHSNSQLTLHQFLSSQGVPGVWGVDTRALTRKLRLHGVMMGVLTSELSLEAAQAHLQGIPHYGDVDFVNKVSTNGRYVWDKHSPVKGQGPDIVVLDCGVKYNIMRLLAQRGCRVQALPASTPAEEILSLNPDGILLSPGPGDPALLSPITQNVKALIGKKPIMGICLGHQLLAWAFGGRTYKLKFGHRGGNHPVKDLVNGQVHITAQNHGYAVDADSLPPEVEVSHINLNDGTVEGLRHRSLPILSIQYHSEASPGPWDNMYLFDRFLEMVKES